MSGSQVDGDTPVLAKAERHLFTLWQVRRLNSGHTACAVIALRYGNPLHSGTC
jgi:hypothetical protein